MTNFPSSLDDDLTLPTVFDNITEVGGEAINAQKEAIIAIETTLGINVQGSCLDLEERLDYLLNPDGSPKTSVLNTVGLVTLPITNTQISGSAAIVESKLALNFSTSDLNDAIEALDVDIDTLSTWVSTNGTAILNHINGTAFKHNLKDIDVSNDSAEFLKNVFGSNRPSTNSYTTINDLNSDYISHQKKDGLGSALPDITTDNGEVYPSEYAHTAGAIYVDTSKFNAFGAIPRLQDLLEFLDNSSLLTFGGRIKNFYSNGISKVSQATRLNSFTEGEEIIPSTSAIAYLRNNGLGSMPIDSIDTGDDVITITPSNTQRLNHTFDALFRSVKPGDIIHVTYSNIETAFSIKELKYDADGYKTYSVRIIRKNIEYNDNCIIRITKRVDNGEKFGVLSVAEAYTNYGSDCRGLTVVNPKSAMVTGIGFDANQFDNTHYNLYLAIYPTSNIADGYQLSVIDVTGNQGTTPGVYSLDQIVSNVNAAFRKIGYNLRMSAFSYKGEFGLALDPINGAGFSIIGGVRSQDLSGPDIGNYEQSLTQISYPNNVIDVFTYSNIEGKDPLGLGPSGSNHASPVYNSTYYTVEASGLPTKLFKPLRKNNYYVGGNEFDDLAKDVDQSIDVNGDGYWLAKFESVINTGGRSSITYRVEKDLSTSGLKVGKSIVIQKNTAGNIKSFGRFIISGVSYYDCSCAEGVYTDIQVVDAVHSNNGASGSSMYLGITEGDEVLLYFGNDSVSFNNEHLSDLTPVPDVFRWFEVLVDDQGKTFANERLRFFNSPTFVEGQLWTNNGGTEDYYMITNISPKLKGFYENGASYIRLNFQYDSTTGIVEAFLSNRDQTKLGNTFIGKCNEPLKVFDISSNDYIEFVVSNTAPLLTCAVDIQLFQSQQNNSSFMTLAGVWVPIFSLSTSLKVTKDLRNFGNISVKDLSTETLNYIAAIDSSTNANGVITGFSLSGVTPTEDLIPNNFFLDSNYFMGSPPVASDKIVLNGGTAIVNGKIVLKNYEALYIPKIVTSLGTTALLYLTLNDNGDYQFFLEKGLSTDPVVQVTSVDDVTTYSINNATLSELRTSKSQLVLYAIKINDSGAEFYPVDLRRYSHDTDTIGVPTVDGTGNGYNFKSVQSMINYSLLDPNLSKELHIKNTTEWLAVYYVDPTIRFYTPTIIDGHNTTTLILAGVSQNAVLPPNTVLKNCTVKLYNNDVFYTAFIGGDGNTYENVNFEYYSNDISSTYPTTPIFSGDEVSYINCTFTFAKSTSLFVSNERLREVHHYVSGALADKEVLFDGCNFINSGVLPSSGIATTLLMIGDNTPEGKVTIKNCSFTGLYGKAIASNINNNNITIDGCTFNSTLDYEVGVGDYPDDNDDILKAIEGEIYIYDNYASTAVSNKSENLTITNNKFLTATTNQCPKILIEAYRAVTSSTVALALAMQNINISHNKFYDDATTTNAMIAIVNKSVSAETDIYFDGSAPNSFPFVLNRMIIENNVAHVTVGINYRKPSNSKSIVIAGITHQKSFVLNDCEIKNNFCQRLGVFGWNSSSSAELTNRELIITNNNIDYIHLSDINGFDRPLESTSPVVNCWDDNTIHYGLNNYIVDFSIMYNSLSWLSTVVNSSINMKSNISNNTFKSKDVGILDLYKGNVYYYRYNTTNNYPIKITFKNSTYAVSPTAPYKAWGRLLIAGNSVVGRYSALFNVHKYVLMTNNEIDISGSDIYFGNYVYGGSVSDNAIKLGLFLGTELFMDGALTGGNVSYKNNAIIDESDVFMVPGYFGNAPRVVEGNIGQQNYAVISLREMPSTLVDDSIANKLIRRLDSPNARSLFTKGYVLNATAIDHYSGIINLSDRLPPGVIIKRVRLGAILRTAAGGVGPLLDVSSSISMTLYTPNHLAGNLGDFTDVNTRTVSGADTTLTSDNSLTGTMNITTLNSNRTIPASTYIDITDGTVTRFVSNHFKSQVVYLTVQMVITRSGATNAEIIFSPIIIEYVHGAL